MSFLYLRNPPIVFKHSSVEYFAFKRKWNRQPTFNLSKEDFAKLKKLKENYRKCIMGS